MPEIQKTSQKHNRNLVCGIILLMLDGDNHLINLCTSIY
jgi:hypothetical protein